MERELTYLSQKLKPTLNTAHKFNAQGIAAGVYKRRIRSLIPRIAVLPAIVGLFFLSSGVGFMSRLPDASFFQDDIQKITPKGDTVIWAKSVKPAFGTNFNLTLDLTNTLRAKTAMGKTLWRYFLPEIATTSAPLVFIKDSTAYVALASAAGSIYFFNGTSGRLIWQQELSDRIDVSPLLVQDSIITIACADGRIYGLDVKDGSITYMLQTDQKISAIEPAVDSDGKYLYAIAAGKRVLGLDALRGDLLWERDTAGFATDTPIVTANNVITPTQNGDTTQLWAFDNNGDLSWMNSFTRDTQYTANKNYLAVADGPIVTLIRAENGEPVYYWQLGSTPQNLALVDHGKTLIVQTDKGDLAATFN